MIYRRICRLNNKPVQFPGSITPFLAYRRMDMRDFCDTICVTPDELLIFSYSPHTMEYIPLEDIQSVAVQNDAIIVNGVTYRLKCSFAPLQEKYDSLVFFIGMALAMKYPAPMPSDDKPVAPAEKLKAVQKLMAEGDERAKKIYETIGVYFGYAVAYYALFYDIKHVLLMGRVSSGEGGSILHKNAEKVLAGEFPELAKKITIHLPDESSRRVGQSIAAASLPLIK